MTDGATVLLADHHILFRDALSDLLDRGGYRVRRAGSFDQAVVKRQDRPAPDLALVEPQLPGMDGLSGLRRLIEEDLHPVAVMGWQVDRGLAEAAFAAGAVGIVLTTIERDVFLHAVRTMMQGERYMPPQLLGETEAPLAPSTAPRRPSLTGREMDVLRLLLRGLANKQIARHLGIGPMTVAMHLTSIFRKLGVTSRSQAIAVALAEGGFGSDAGRGPQPRRPAT